MASKASAANENIDIGEGKSEAISYKVENRLSLELIIGLVGPVGSGVSTTVKALVQKLTDVYGYEVHCIKVSELIRENAASVQMELAGVGPGVERIEAYQKAGNALRKIKGNNHLADRAIERIAYLRQNNAGFIKTAEGVDVPVQKRIAYVIDSLKNPAEIQRLRQIYGDLFWAITVFAPHDVRERRIVTGGLGTASAGDVMKRDQEEEEKSGQQVSRTAHLSDYFIRNHKDTTDILESALNRFLEVIFGTKLHTPSFDEQGIMKAAAAGIQSACLSRQVGASIYNIMGDLIGVGCNDVPVAGGGLYGDPFGRPKNDLKQEDNRCYKWGGGVCHNDERKARLALSVARKVSEAVPKEEMQNAIDRTLEAVQNSDAKNLIEFSRSVHAEMEAIVSVARTGAGSTIGGTLFTTTFPCHNCARHIVAAGINRVVFIEPYSKSLALKLHYDSITLSDESDKVQFQQYEGFSPRASIRAFSSAGIERKTNGKYEPKNARNASPIFPFPLDSYINSERLVVQQLAGE